MVCHGSHCLQQSLLHSRYIEIFKSSLAEANAVTGRDRGYRSSMGMGRPGPYDRNDRFGGPMGPGGGPVGMGYNRGRGGRNVKGKLMGVIF